MDLKLRKELGSREAEGLNQLWVDTRDHLFSSIDKCCLGGTDITLETIRGQRPILLISHGGRFAYAAAVAAPILKLWPAYSVAGNPAELCKLRISMVNADLVRYLPVRY